MWVAQRVSAGVLGIAVLVHLVTMSYAVRGGLTATEILARTRGSLGWLLFYGVFVLAVAVHAPIGLRTVAREWAGWRGGALDTVVAVVAAALLVLGWRAVWAVYA
jgi:fumarate reductase subunit C